MKVSAHYAFSNFEDIASAVDRGELVEILRPGKSTLQLVPAPTPEPRPARRILGAGRGELRIPSEEEWRAMDKELESQMNDTPLMTTGEV